VVREGSNFAHYPAPLCAAAIESVDIAALGAPLTRARASDRAPEVSSPKWL
jgi:hypothetical protein